MFLPNLLIALREGLEATLVVSILVAYLVKSGRRDVLPKLWIGVAAAAALPLILGAVLTWGPKTLTFQAQEILGGSLALLAVALTTGMIFWMSKNARGQKQNLEGELSRALAHGAGWGVALVAIAAVGREGLETALFVWATVKSSVENSVAATSAGLVVGLALAVVLGILLYRGALHLNLGRFFTWTGGLLILIAAGIVAYGIGDFQEAGVLPGLNTYAWDVSALLPATTSPVYWLYVVGQAMFQVNVQPTVLQVVAWLLYVVPVTLLFVRRVRAGAPRPVREAAVPEPAAV
ncbi:iron transporter [Brachybacterium avium]|uniref:Iron transporter n=1 Tax=Brachybacterium avium TaxID=2017485 RepID=A0A220UAR7_9MICO|nr:iron uptake transporter permease EfeU [Brachybacterium avium]ASK65072.1 iron transporter [Brachybacterium avium]